MRRTSLEESRYAGGVYGLAHGGRPLRLLWLHVGKVLCPDARCVTTR